MLTFGSLFAGIGGFDLGFERAGMKCCWQVEIDDYANRVLAKHWPDVRRWRDVRTFPPEPADDWRVDVICGGFPCQDISYAGAGAGLDGERSGLFFEAVRVVRQLQPRVLVLENVAALLTRGLDRVLGTLAEVGYDAEWHCIPAAAVGAPHIRDRVFVIAYAAEFFGNGRVTREHCSQRKIQQQARGICCNADVADTKEPHGFSNDPKFQGKVQTGMGGGCNKRHAWATEPDVGRVANGVPARVDRLKGLGNAVVPQVAEWIGRRIVESA
jgi:DNA (cytosine-5)-methyltransferase 1